MGRQRGLIIAGVVGGLVVLLVAARALGTSSDEGDDGARENVESTTTTEAPSTTTTAPPATTTTLPPPPGPIPGLTASGIHQRVIDAGWYCAPAAGESSPGYVQTQCGLIGTGVSLTTYATPTGEAVYARVSVMFASEYEWLELLATMPWDGAQPETAGAWVEQVTTGIIDFPYVTSFGGVDFEMLGQSGFTQWYLSIGDEPPT